MSWQQEATVRGTFRKASAKGTCSLCRAKEMSSQKASAPRFFCPVGFSSTATPPSPQRPYIVPSSIPLRSFFEIVAIHTKPIFYRKQTQITENQLSNTHNAHSTDPPLSVHFGGIFAAASPPLQWEINRKMRS